MSKNRGLSLYFIAYLIKHTNIYFHNYKRCSIGTFFGTLFETPFSQVITYGFLEIFVPISPPTYLFLLFKYNFLFFLIYSFYQISEKFAAVWFIFAQLDFVKNKLNVKNKETKTKLFLSWDAYATWLINYES